jgi:probable F420-dependent oxidoreductase
LEFFLHGGYSPLRDFMEIAKVADEVGIDGVLIPDHVFLPTTLQTPYPYTADGNLPMPLSTIWPDPWVLVGALGTLTSRLRFLSNVYVLALRNPLFAAKTVGTASVITDGRVLLGVGVGWLKDEFDALGSPFTSRGKVTDRSIGILRKLWAEGKHEAYHDEFFDFPELIMEPKPPSAIPILIGGSSEAAFDRAARLGDGFVTTPNSVEAHLTLWADLQARLVRLERDPSTFQFRAGCNSVDLGDFERLAKAGVAGVSVRLWPTSEQDLGTKLSAIEAFVDHVLRPFRQHAG